MHKYKIKIKEGLIFVSDKLYTVQYIAHVQKCSKNRHHAHTVSSGTWHLPKIDRFGMWSKYDWDRNTIKLSNVEMKKTGNPVTAKTKQKNLVNHPPTYIHNYTALLSTGTDLNRILRIGEEIIHTRSHQQWQWIILWNNCRCERFIS